MGKQQSRRREYLYFFLAFSIITLTVLGACAHLHEEFLVRPFFKDADDLFTQGDYMASLSRYEQILHQYPRIGDRALFQMGIIYSFPGNQHKDYQKSLVFFENLVKEYPESRYRHDSIVMISLIKEIAGKDRKMITQRKQIDMLERQLITQKKQVETLERQVEELEKKIAQMKEVDMYLKAKKKTFPK